MTAPQPASSMDNNGGHARGLKPCPALAAAISELSIAIAFALSTLILLLCEGSEWEWMGHVEPFLRYASMWALQRLLLVFRAQPTVTLHFGGAIHQQQRRVLSAHDARASTFGCFVPWPLPAVMDWQPLGVAVTTCVLQVSGRISRLRLILQYSCLSAMSAPRSLTPPHARCTACLHACALHRCLPSPDAACAIERPPTSSPMLACLGSVLTPSACLPHRPRRRV